MMTLTLTDQRAGFGTVSRGLHWAMAALFAWQLVTVVLRVTAEDTPIESFFFSTHVSVGCTLWILVLFRGAWGLANMGRRPLYEGPRLLGRIATAYHVLLYAGMTAIPLLAIIRATGSRYGLTVWGLELWPARDPHVPFLVGFGELHGELGWALYALIVGHVAAALYHHLVLHDRTLRRMTDGWRA